MDNKKIVEVTTSPFNDKVQEIAFWTDEKTSTLNYVPYEVWNTFVSDIINVQYNMKGVTKEELQNLNIDDLKQKEADLKFFLKSLSKAIKTKETMG